VSSVEGVGIGFRVQASEVVIPFIKEPQHARTTRSFRLSSYCNATFQQRFSLPGGEWLYLKLYMHKEDMNRFLCRFTAPQKEWFFLRYRDPDPHLRLRIRGETLKQLHSQLINWHENFFVQRVVVETYERELERYEDIELAQAIFSEDSCDVIDLLKELPNYKEEVFFPLCVITFLRSFQKSDQEIKDFLSNRSKEHRKGFREHKNQLLQLVNELPTFFMQKQMQSAVSDSVLHSYLHMHCNRLGCPPEMEEKAREYAYQTLKIRDLTSN